MQIAHQVNHPTHGERLGFGVGFFVELGFFWKRGAAARGARRDSVQIDAD
jgi:hypothetical protein